MRLSVHGKDIKQLISAVCLWFLSAQARSPHTFKICSTTESKILLCLKGRLEKPKKPPVPADTCKVFNSLLPNLSWLSPLVAEVPPNFSLQKEVGDSAFCWVCFQGNVAVLKPQDSHFPRQDGYRLGINASTLLLLNRKMWL